MAYLMWLDYSESGLVKNEEQAVRLKTLIGRQI